MTAKQIFEQTLIKTDGQILASLDSTPRIACCRCELISVRKRPSYSETTLCFCLKCRRDVTTKVVNYYPKHVTTVPALALKRYRRFWNRAYYQQLYLDRAAWRREENARLAHKQAHLDSLGIRYQPWPTSDLKLTRWTGALGL